MLYFVSTGESKKPSQEFVKSASLLGMGRDLDLTLESSGHYIIFGAKGDGDHWSSTSQLPYRGYTWKSKGGSLIIDGQEGMITVYPNPAHQVPIVFHEDIALEPGDRSVEIGTIVLDGSQWPLMAELSESSLHIID